MQKLQVNWGTNKKGHWCLLYDTDFSELDFSGVYVIWGATKFNQRVIKVGQSINLFERFSHYKNDGEVINYFNQFNGYTYVTWAELQQEHLDRVERYLGTVHYQPLIAKRFPDVLPLAVNAPF